MAALPTDRLKAAPLRRPVRALAMGTLAGSALVAGTIAVVVIVVGLMQGALGEALAGGVLMATLFFLLSFPVWAVGLIMVGAPSWSILHALGWRSRGAGAAFGAAAAFVAAWRLGAWLNLSTDGAPPLSLMASPLALIGAVVGWIVVSIGYDEGKKPQ